MNKDHGQQSNPFIKFCLVRFLCFNDVKLDSTLVYKIANWNFKSVHWAPRKVVSFSHTGTVK